MASDLVALAALAGVLGGIILVMAVTSARRRLRAASADPLVPEMDPLPSRSARTTIPRALAASSMFTAPSRK